ncbi:MAG TPA: carbohydrate ABC transporter permease [Chloroflexota bacterium]|jgi:ABC-type glycerol-3-phosphate transport system permease component
MAAVARAGAPGRRTTSRSADTGFFVLLVLLALIFVFPLYWTLSSSLKAPYEILTYPPTFIPAVPQWGNYERVFINAPFARWIFNTIFVVALGTLGAVLSSSLVAYSFARFRYRGRDLIFLLTLGTMMLPAQVTLIPQYILWSKLGFVNTLYPLWLPQWFGGGAFNIFLLRQFILTLPRELDEAALIDGASRFRIFWTILLPLCIPALATVTIISFIANWDDYLSPLVYLNSQEMYTLALGLSFFKNYPESGGLPQQHLLMAATVMTTLPPIVLFFAAQRYFVKGIVLSGLKG